MDEVVPLVSDDELAPEFSDYVSERKKTKSWVPNNIYALANAPELGMAARGIFDAAQTVGSLPRDLRYLIRHSPYDRCRSPRLGDFGLPSNTGRRPRRKRRSA